MRCLPSGVLVWLAMVVPNGATPYDSGVSGPSEVLLKAMGDELERTVVRMRLEGLAEPYFVAQTVLESRTLELQGNFGGLERSREQISRRLQVEVRAGAREFDDSHYVGTQTGNFRPLSAALPVEDEYEVLRNEIWALSDRAYKRAVERLARKRVYRKTRNIQDEIPDLTEDPVRTFRKTQSIPPFDREKWERWVREVSAVFRGFPDVQTSGVSLTWRAQHLYFVDSEGRSSVKPSHRFDLAISASAQAEDGMVQSDRREMVWAALDQVPPLAELKAEAEALARDISSLSRARKIGSYLGPVLLEQQAAGEFFNQLLASGVSAPRRIWVEQKWVEQYFEAGALASRLGLRVIAPMFDVYDDPRLASWENRPLSGHYEIDDQGIPAQRVDLVERGILEDVLMSRSPTKERRQSNGHGRGAFSSPATGSIGNLIVSASETVRFEKMKDILRKEAKAFGLDYGVVVRRISPERNQENDEMLSAPVLVYQIDVGTGEEELVRDARFSAVTMRALRDIIAASSEQHIINLGKPGPYRGGPTRASIVHPSVLLSEMELTETERKPSKPPYMEHPFFAGTGGE